MRGGGGGAGGGGGGVTVQKLDCTYDLPVWAKAARYGCGVSCHTAMTRHFSLRAACHS